MKYSGSVWRCADRSREGRAEAGWGELLPEALGYMGPHERALLMRIAEAQGRRVPIGELVTALGLPPAPSLDHDFPGLSRFVAERSRAGKQLAMPVVSSGTDDKGWYWMAAEDSVSVRAALTDAV